MKTMRSNKDGSYQMCLKSKIDESCSISDRVCSVHFRYIALGKGINTCLLSDSTTNCTFQARVVPTREVKLLWMKKRGETDGKSLYFPMNTLNQVLILTADVMWPTPIFYVAWRGYVAFRRFRLTRSMQRKIILQQPTPRSQALNWSGNTHTHTHPNASVVIFVVWKKFQDIEYLCLLEYIIFEL